MAYDHSFSKKNLGRHLLKAEIGAIAKANRDNFRENITKSSFDISNTYLKQHSIFNKISIKKKPVYTIPFLEYQLIIRKLNQNLKKCFKSNEKNRNIIIKRLTLFLQESIPYNVYRLDVSNFYESINQEHLFKLINQNHYLCNHSKNLISEIFSQFSLLNGQGIPRGIMISSTLSELVMAAFDIEVTKHKEVFFYQRYVDDIIIITSGRENSNNFKIQLENNLPIDLTFNTEKTKILKIKKDIDKKNIILGNFDYLGYDFTIHPNKDKSLPRKIEIEIAKKKLNKIKSKIIRSFIVFKINQNFNLLMERLNFLSTNYSIYDRKKSKKKIAGLYYSYPLISPQSRSLKLLDNYYRNIILSPSGFSHLNIYSSLTQSQKRTLLKISFSKGHINRTFNYFSGNKIKEIQECWKNV